MSFSPTARRRRGRGAVPGRLLFLGSLLVALAARPAPAATYSVAGFSDIAVVMDLSAPTDFAFLPDGRILILEKAGRVLVTGPSGGTPAVALDMRTSVDDLSERGLLGICLHPGFATNGYVFLYYTTNVPKNRISRFTLTGNTISPASES
jgi:glucose/arabinose dehydrogenase